MDYSGRHFLAELDRTREQDRADETQRKFFETKDAIAESERSIKVLENRPAHSQCYVKLSNSLETNHAAAFELTTATRLLPIMKERYIAAKKDAKLVQTQLEGLYH